MMRLIWTILVLLLVGCATAPHGADYVPLVDMQGKADTTFAADLAACQGYARQRIDATRGAVAGAIVGALLGASIAPRGYRGYSAGNGAVLGTAAGAAHATGTQEGIVKLCLAGRGYNVLN